MNTLALHAFHYTQRHDMTRNTSTLCRYAMGMARSPTPFNAFWKSVVDMYIRFGYISFDGRSFYDNKRKK